MSDVALPSTGIVIFRLVGSYLVGVLITSFVVSLPGAGELFPLMFLTGAVAGAPILAIVALFVVTFKRFVHSHLTGIAWLLAPVVTTLLMLLHYFVQFAGHMPVQDYLVQAEAAYMAAAALLGTGITAYTFIRLSTPRYR